MRFNDPEYADFYNRRQIDSGYPGRLLDPVMENLSGSSTVLDIGSGTGFFAIPLAEKGVRVTAVEPSKDMTRRMEERCPEEARGYITIENLNWEEWSGPVHDSAICIHSLYPMADPIAALEKMLQYSGKRIVIIRDSAAMKTLSGIVREKLKLNHNRDLNPLVKDLLIRRDLPFLSVNIKETREYRIKDPAIETESLLYQLRLGKDYFHSVLSIVEKHSEEHETGMVFHQVFSDNVWIF
jgi:FkbM family methyltransferase